jgi:hypothetical protein
MRDPRQTLSDYERSESVARTARRHDSAWVQDASSEGGRVVTPNLTQAPFPYGHPGFWAKITGRGTLDGTYIPGGDYSLPDNRNQYTWDMVVRQVALDDAGRPIVTWLPLDGVTNMAVVPRPELTGATKDDDGKVIGGTWEMVKDPAAPHPLVVQSKKSDNGSIANAAFEVSGSQAVLPGTIVWMWPAEGDWDVQTDPDPDYPPKHLDQHYLFCATPTLVRVKLLEDHYECGDAKAVVMLFGQDKGSSSGSATAGGACCDTYAEGDHVTVRDQLGVIGSHPLSRTSWDGKNVIPAGYCEYVLPVTDNPKAQYEVIAVGKCSCKSSSSSSSSSASLPPSSSSSSSSSSKSTAIVPASWSPTGYAALFVEECPEVRFDDVTRLRVPQENANFPIDPKYTEVCEPGSVEVCGCVPDMPVVVGASAEDGRVYLRFAKQRPDRTVQIVIRLTGVRKGFAGTRFPDRTREQFESNERFIRSAYNGEQ